MYPPHTIYVKSHDDLRPPLRKKGMQCEISCLRSPASSPRSEQSYVNVRIKLFVISLQSPPCTLTIKRYFLRIAGFLIHM